MKISIDGEIVEKENACISVMDHGLLYGDGVFEGIRIYNRRVFRLQDHLDRLSLSAKAIGLELPVDRAEIQKQILDTARALDQDNAYIRLLITRGQGTLGIDPATCRNPRVIVIVDQIQLYAKDKAAQGVKLVTSSFRRPASDVLDPRVKSLNYLNSVMAKMEAKRYGADEALLLNQSGMIAEASAANVFIVSNQELMTPPTTDGALPGITRKTVIELAASLELKVQEKTMGRYDLIDADEAFLTGTGARITKIHSLDDRTIGKSDRWTIIEQVMAAFDSYTQTNGTPF